MKATVSDDRQEGGSPKLSPKTEYSESLMRFAYKKPDNVSMTKSAGSYLLIEVTDTGIGISDDKIKTLFAPFQQAQRFAGGTGLGLFSLARRVEAQNGACGLRKRDDGVTGSVFWFMLPYVPDPTMEQECMINGGSPTFLGTLSPVRTSVMSELSEVGGPDNGRESARSPSTRHLAGLPQAPLNILLVDDSISVMKTTRMMLTKQGHTVDTAVNGADALDSLLKKSYDIVLMDIQVCIYSQLPTTSLSPLTLHLCCHTVKMPVMDGTECVSRFRKAECDRSTDGNTASRQLIVGCSANSDSATHAAAVQAGMDGFLNKPMTRSSFLEVYNKLK